MDPDPSTKLDKATHELDVLWDAHRTADWPSGLGSNEGEFMMLDTVISGCVTYYLESDNGLDSQRVEILKSCLSDLENLLPEVEDEDRMYFDRLQALGSLLLAKGRVE